MDGAAAYFKVPMDVDCIAQLRVHELNVSELEMKYRGGIATKQLRMCYTKIMRLG